MGDKSPGSEQQQRRTKMQSKYLAPFSLMFYNDEHCIAKCTVRFIRVSLRHVVKSNEIFKGSLVVLQELLVGRVLVVSFQILKKRRVTAMRQHIAAATTTTDLLLLQFDNPACNKLRSGKGSNMINTHTLFTPFVSFASISKGLSSCDAGDLRDLVFELEHVVACLLSKLL